MIELDPAHINEYKDIISRLSGKHPADYALSPKHTHYFAEIIPCIYVLPTLLMSGWYLHAQPVANMAMERI